MSASKVNSTLIIGANPELSDDWRRNGSSSIYIIVGNIGQQAFLHMENILLDGYEVSMSMCTHVGAWYRYHRLTNSQRELDLIGFSAEYNVHIRLMSVVYFRVWCAY